MNHSVKNIIAREDVGFIPSYETFAMAFARNRQYDQVDQALTHAFTVVFDSHLPLEIEQEYQNALRHAVEVPLEDQLINIEAVLDKLRAYLAD